MDKEINTLSDIFKHLAGEKIFKNKSTACKYIILKYVLRTEKVKRETLYKEVEKPLIQSKKLI